MSDFRLPTLEELRECLETSPCLVETPAGPVEYATRGQGPLLLCVHGGPGGFDQGLVLGELFRVNGFRTVAVSRPGYLGTPLSSGASPEAQADLLAALLTALDEPSALVIGVSAGGPPSYLLAARHPQRVRALVEVDSVSRTYRPGSSETVEKLFVSRFGLALTGFLARHFPMTTLRGLLTEESTLDKAAIAERAAHVLADPSRRAMFETLIRTFSDRAGQRLAGVTNDLAVTRELGDLPLGAITCPVLILHGQADNDVSPEHATFAAAAIAGAKLEWIEAGSHLGFWLADTAEAVQGRTVAWLRAVA